jgi:pilus assembly protein FimV
MKGPRKTLLASSILAIPSLAQALGLGGIEVKSGLNEPLVAEIQVIQSAPGEADGLAVALASAEDFARVGIDRARMEMPLTFTVSKGAAGQAVIKVTSAVPVKEPFLNFLLEVNWSKGRLLREYTVLLDPPVSAPARGSQVATAPVRDTAPVAPVAAEPAPEPMVAAEPVPAPAAEPTPAPEPAPAAEPAPEAAATPEPVPVAAEPATPSPAPSGDYGPIGQGETLWEIANATRPEGVADMNKFMIALLRMNPDAFYEQNINALKRGAILRIPTGDDVNAIAASEAAEAVRGQNELWRGYQASQSAAPTTLADAGASESLRTPPASTSTSGSRLELLPPRAGEDQGAADRPGDAGLQRSGEEIKNLRGDLARSQEDLESSRQEVSELRSRVADLEKIKTDQDKVLSLRNDELKALQSRAAELEKRIRELEALAASAQAAADKAAADAAAAQSEPKPADIWKPEDQPPADAAAPADTAVEPSADVGTEPPADASTPPADTAEPVAATEPPADTTPEPAPSDTAPPVPTDTAATTQPVSEPAPAEPVPAEPAPPAAGGGLFSNPWVLGGIGAAALALFGLLFARRRKKDEAAAEFGAGEAAADDHGGYFPAERAPAIADVGDAEEEALLDQVAMNPSDLRARLNLLRLYAGHGNATAFEEAARALRAQIASEDQPEWREAAQLAAGILPGHPLFQRKDELPEEVTFEEPEAAPSESVESSFDLNAFDESPAQPAAPVAPPALQAAAEPNFDFDFDLDAPTQAIEPVKPAPAPAPAPAASRGEELSFDFDLDIPAPAPAPVATPEPIAAAPAPAPVKEEFSLDLPEIDFAAVEAPKVEAPKIAEPAAPSMDDELGDLGVFGDDAVATKLDLARAYMDMGDPDGARSMLEEVIGEGNAAQQDEARKLLGSLG